MRHGEPPTRIPIRNFPYNYNYKASASPSQFPPPPPIPPHRPPPPPPSLPPPPPFSTVSSAVPGLPQSSAGLCRGSTGVLHGRGTTTVSYSIEDGEVFSTVLGNLCWVVVVGVPTGRVCEPGYIIGRVWRELLKRI